MMYRGRYGMTGVLKAAGKCSGFFAVTTYFTIDKTASVTIERTPCCKIEFEC